MTEVVPAGWQIMPLKFATDDFQNGIWGSDPNGGPDDILCARVADFDRKKLQVTDVPTIRRVPKNDRDRCSVQHGDILVEKSGGTPRNPVGTVVSYQGDLPAVYANFIFRLRMSSEQDQRFWLYALHASYLDGRTWSLVRQTTGIQNLDTNGFMSMKHPAPPLQTQRHIADYLDRETVEIDAMIDKLGDLQETLLARKVEVIRNSTQLSASGKSWDTVPTAHLFGNIGSGTTPKAERHYTEPGEGVPWVTTSELRESVIRSTSKNVTTEALESVSSLTLHPKGSVLIAMYGATIGRLGVLGVDATMNQACCAFSLPIGIDMRFFYYTLWGQRDDIIRLAVGGGQPNISQNMLRRWRIPLPPLEEQRRIADHLDSVTSKIDAMLTKVAQLKDLLTERRAALITDVVTGRKDVA
ncbi:MAG: restriction endonuclease subunit S [Micrococcaceae bacterium]|nr:restriction endonuclease subunit S [Micrococcaceae bacterium]